MTEGLSHDTSISESEQRLRSFLRDEGEDAVPQPLTPDASTRDYFRVSWRGETCVACVYPEPFGDELPYLDVTALFTGAGLPVADVITTAGDKGILMQKDLGYTTLADFLQTSGEGKRDEMLHKAVELIAQIQAATPLAFTRDSIASRLKFDVEKLGWELGFFLEHYFESLKGRPLPKSLETDVRGEFAELVEELEGFSRTLTHRDFHSSNLMVGDDGKLWIIDHQDARIGSPAYDLASLLLDRVTKAPDKIWLENKRNLLLKERTKAGLENIDPDNFAFEFDLVAVQRCLKAIGTFSNQAGNIGKTHYTVYIDPMFEIVSGICHKLNRFPAVREMIIRHTA